MTEVQWTDLTKARREQLLNRCGYAERQWKMVWQEFEAMMQLLLARELEAISGNTTTIKCFGVELLTEPDAIGWENNFDPRICSKDDPGVQAALARAKMIEEGTISENDSVFVDYVTRKVRVITEAEKLAGMKRLKKPEDA